jgi:hypothetical protein
MLPPIFIPRDVYWPLPEIHEAAPPVPVPDRGSEAVPVPAWAALAGLLTLIWLKWRRT